MFINESQSSVISVIPLQFANAIVPIELMVLGMLTDVIPLHPSNAVSAIERTVYCMLLLGSVTVLGIFNSPVGQLPAFSTIMLEESIAVYFKLSKTKV